MLLSTQGSFPAQALPRVFGTTSLSATLTTQPSPADYRFGVCHTIARASRVATLLIFHACQRHYPGGNTSVPVSLTSPCILGLLPNCDRIDLPRIGQWFEIEHEVKIETPLGRPAQVDFASRTAAIKLHTECAGVYHGAGLQPLYVGGGFCHR